MSLRAFAKGFSTAAAPSFIRSFEGQQDRIETRRREERAYTREDKIRAEDIEREDFNRSLEDAKASLLAGANTGDKAEVQKAYDALSEEVKGELSMVLPGYMQKATRTKRQLDMADELHSQKMKTHEAQLSAASASEATSKFELGVAQGEKSGRDQFNRGNITDENGLAYAQNMMLSLQQKGINAGNLAQAKNIARIIDTYTGASGSIESVEASKVANDEETVFNQIFHDPENYTPSTIRAIAFGMKNPEIKARLLAVAKAELRANSEARRKGVFDVAYQAAFNAGKPHNVAYNEATQAADKYSQHARAWDVAHKINDIGERIVGMFDGQPRENLTIERVMSVAEQMFRQEGIAPTDSQINKLRTELQNSLFSNVATGPMTPVGPATTPAPAPLTPDLPDPSGGTVGGEGISGALNVNKGSLWDKWGISGHLERGLERREGRGGGGRFGGGGRGGIRSSPVDATGGR